MIVGNLSPPAPLTRDAFAAFGDVVEFDGAAISVINAGYAERARDLATVDLGRSDGKPSVSIFKAKARQTPMTVTLMERHPLGSQLFFPLSGRGWLVIVCADPADPKSYAVFRATRKQGVNYRPGVWHHPLIALEDGATFLIVDRTGPGGNCDEVAVGGFHLAF